MRPLDGLQVLWRIRAERHWRELPVLAMLRAQERPCAAQLLQAGADDTLNKPLEASRIVARVWAHAELHRRRQAG
jgi:adenylate cyclase